ncbi:hypothetical protein [Hymenobacter nivis]|uniref:Uncharacterized protein n=1 Tax=Hymenobacter nivis TaxID=1850093 RepID=A0A502HBW4_9BACT|nr:hypothetical protein [Hymenobacter nivis]TPG72001.1 hypothetical protein EAH73_01785 [Hymenobacter nivis]
MKPTPASDPLAQLPDTNAPLRKRELLAFAKLYAANLLTSCDTLQFVEELGPEDVAAVEGHLAGIAARYFDGHPAHDRPADIIKYLKSLRPSPPPRPVD